MPLHDVSGTPVGPACVLKQTTSQSVGNAVDVRATWDTVLFDPLKMFSSGANTRITVPDPGWYKVGFSMAWGGTGAGTSTRRTFWTMWQNGAAAQGLAAVLGGANNAGYSGFFGEAPLLAAAGDYFEVDCFQDGTGSAQTLQNPCLFWAYRMAW